MLLKNIARIRFLECILLLECLVNQATSPCLGGLRFWVFVDTSLCISKLAEQNQRDLFFLVSRKSVDYILAIQLQECKFFQLGKIKMIISVFL